MLYTALTKRAMLLAYEIHREQTDRYGMPRICHLLHVAEQMKDEDTTVVALLHESMEHGGATMSDLRKAGIPEKDIAAISVMTYRGERQYIRFIRRIRENRIAAAVKNADLIHDCDITRMGEITDDDGQRIAKYERALRVLARKEVFG